MATTFEANSTRVAFARVSTSIARLQRLALALALACGAGPVLAQGVTTTNPQDTCAGFRAGSDLNCTAGEGSILATFTPIGGGTCVAGSMVTVDVAIQFNGEANVDRQDLGFFAGILGNNPQLATAGDICAVTTFTSASTAPWEDNDGDACFDMDRGGVGSATATGITVLCDPDINGNLQLPFVLTYQQNNNEVCTGPSDVQAGTGSKCIVGVGAVEGLTANGFINITKQTLPDGSAQTFDFTATGDATPNPTAFTLSDGGTQQVLMPIVEGTPRTLTIDETNPAGFEVDSIVCTAPGGGSAAAYVTIDEVNGTISAELDDVNVGADCTITNQLAPAPALTLDKTTTATGFAAIGNSITYSYLVTNSGNVALAGPVTVIDNRVIVTCPAGGLAVGASTTCTATYVVVQADLDAGSVTNIATASANGTDSNQDTVTVNGTQTRSLLLDKTAAPPTYTTVGQSINYMYVVTNTGNVTLIGPVTVADNKATVTCPAGNLAPGVFITCTATYTITQADINAGSVTNTATATVASTDPDTVSNTDTATVTAVVSSGLTLDKTSTTTTYTAVGGSLVYSYIVTNSGSVSLAGPVTVADNRATVTCPAVTTVGNFNSSLDPGESITCTASHIVTQADLDAGSVTNTATATAGGVTSNPDSVTITATQTRTLLLDKTTTSTGYSAVGNTLSYSYRVTNTGNTSLAGPVTVTDNRATVTCPASGLAPGAFITCTATYTVTQADISAGSVTNTATASANGVTSNTDSVTVVVNVDPPPFVEPLPVPVDSRWVLIAIALLLGFAAQRRLSTMRRGN